MKDYNTYIFDLDGTITNTMTVWLGILRDALIAFEISPPDDKTISRYTHDWREMVELGLPADQIAAYGKYCHTLANQRLPQADLHAGAYEFLERLKADGKNIAIFSTMDRPMFEPAMNYRNLYSLVEVAIAGTDVPRRKPHPDGIFKALADLGIPQEQYGSAVYIGDKDTDLQAASNAGIDGVLFYPTVHQQMYDLNELKKYNPAYIVTDWQEVRYLLQK